MSWLHLAKGKKAHENRELVSGIVSQLRLKPVSFRDPNRQNKDIERWLGMSEQLGAVC
jgi:hypothetical protein